MTSSRTRASRAPAALPPALALFTSLALLAIASPANAQEAAGFGEKRQLILSADRLIPVFSYASTSETGTQGNLTVTRTDSGASIALLLGREPTLAAVHTIPRVAFDYAVVRHLTIGGSIAFGFGLSRSSRTESRGGGTSTETEQDEPNTRIVGFAPRVGYVLPLGRSVAFWPRAGFAFYSVSTRFERGAQGGQGGESVTDSDAIFSLDLDPQFVFTPIEHFFFNIGPLVNIPLTGSRDREVAPLNGGGSNTASQDLSVFHLGVSAGLGGWFDL